MNANDLLSAVKLPWMTDGEAEHAAAFAATLRERIERVSDGDLPFVLEALRDIVVHQAVAARIEARLGSGASAAAAANIIEDLLTARKALRQSLGEAKEILDKLTPPARGLAMEMKPLIEKTRDIFEQNDREREQYERDHGMWGRWASDGEFIPGKKEPEGGFPDEDTEI